MIILFLGHVRYVWILHLPVCSALHCTNFEVWLDELRMAVICTVSSAVSDSVTLPYLYCRLHARNAMMTRYVQTVEVRPVSVFELNGRSVQLSITQRSVAATVKS